MEHWNFYFLGKKTQPQYVKPCSLGKTFFLNYTLVLIPFSLVNNDANSISYYSVKGQMKNDAKMTHCLDFQKEKYPQLTPRRKLVYFLKPRNKDRRILLHSCLWTHFLFRKITEKLVLLGLLYLF